MPLDGTLILLKRCRLHHPLYKLFNPPLGERLESDPCPVWERSVNSSAPALHFSSFASVSCKVFSDTVASPTYDDQVSSSD
jgi:hypothetical protein